MPEVSVVVPLYGGHTGRGSLPVVTGAWLGQDVRCEVVIATAGEIPVTVAEDLDGDRTVKVVRADAATRAPGLLRNLAAAHARSSVLYLSDADVVPLGRDYLTRALQLADERALSQPWMYRLVGGIDALGGPSPLDLWTHRVVGSGQFCFVTAMPDGTLRPHDGEQITWRERARGGVRSKHPLVFLPAALAPTDTRRWRAPFHWGALMLDRQVFEDVGAYCRRYLGWGCEDDDLLVKVAAHNRLIRGWQVDPTLSCLHFEHPYAYDGTPECEANRTLYRERLAAGPVAMIEEDRSALGASRNGQGIRASER